MSENLIWQHAACGTFGRFFGPRCEGCGSKYGLDIADVSLTKLANLASNLRIAAFGQAMFNASAAPTGLVPFGPGFVDRVAWSPNVEGRPAPAYVEAMEEA
jgi:hypothetical protein